MKWSVEPARAADVPAAIARAYYTAMQPPQGPTFVSIPEDDWDAEAATSHVAARCAGDFVGEPEALGAVAAALNDSAHPGARGRCGVDRDGAWDLVVALAERTGATVWVSPLSGRCSFPEDHPAFAGFLTPPRAPTRRAARAARRRRRARRAGVHLPRALRGRRRSPTAPRCSCSSTTRDAAAFAPVGTAVAHDAAPRHRRPARARDGRREREPAGREPRARRRLPAIRCRARSCCTPLREVMPDDAVIVEEAPSHRNAMHDHLPIRRSDGFYCGASGGLGWALPAAVGIGLARPERRVVCLLGDGSSLYSIQALWTAAEHRAPDHLRDPRTTAATQRSRRSASRWASRRCRA